MQTAIYKYVCTGYRPVSAESIESAAEMFASREARRRYGKRGYCRLCDRTFYSPDGAIVEFSAFIGYSSAPGETTGTQINFTVRATDK